MGRQLARQLVQYDRQIRQEIKELLRQLQQMAGYRPVGRLRGLRAYTGNTDYPRSDWDRGVGMAPCALVNGVLLWQHTPYRYHRVYDGAADTGATAEQLLGLRRLCERATRDHLRLEVAGIGPGDLTQPARAELDRRYEEARLLAVALGREHVARREATEAEARLQELPEAVERQEAWREQRRRLLSELEAGGWLASGQEGIGPVEAQILHLDGLTAAHQARRRFLQGPQGRF